MAAAGSSLSLIAFALAIAVLVSFIVRFLLPGQSQWPWFGPLCLIRSQSQRPSAMAGRAGQSRQLATQGSSAVTAGFGCGLARPFEKRRAG